MSKALKTGPIVFLRQVRAEMVKVTWPVRREVVVSTVMVLIMVIVAAAFFFLADWVMSSSVRVGIGFLGNLFQ